MRTQVLHIKAAGKIAEKYHRKFQSLGFMDTHNRDCIGMMPAGNQQSTIFNRTQIVQKLRQVLQVLLFVISSHLIKQLKIGGFSLSVRHCTIDTVQFCHAEAYLKKRGYCTHFCLVTEDLQNIQKMTDFLAITQTKSLVKSAFFLHTADDSQIVGRKSKNRAG